MTDIASLGIRVQTTGAKEAKADLDQLTTSGAKAEQSIKKVAPAFDKAGVSAKQLQFATRGLPAQFTDIATSLGSGQRPLQVLLQQGGQIKDMFGGIGPAIRAVGGYVAGLINPFTLAAAAVVGLGLAWKSAADEAQAFNLAIIDTGNFSGKSAKELQDLAAKLDATTDATGRFASEILAKVVATGRFTGDQVGIVSTAIVNMAKATQLAGGDVDEAVKSLIKNFTDLSKDPVEALLKLNETQHFLTESTLQQVDSLVKQGKETEAAEVAIKAMADTLNQRAPEMVANVNSASAVFGGLKSAIAEATDEAVNFFRTADEGLQRFIRNHQGAVAALAKLQSFPLLPFGGTQQTITESLLGNAKRQDFSAVTGTVTGNGLRVVDSAEERRKIKEVEDAQREWNSSVRQGETTAQRLKRELDEAEAAGKRLGKTGAEIAAAQDAIRAAFAARAPKGKKPKKENTRGIENASDRFDDMVGSLRAEMEGPLQRAEEQHLKRMREIQQAARDGKRSHDDLAAALKLEGEAYAKTRTEIEQRIDAEVASLSGPLASAQSQHEQALRRIEELQKSGRVSGDEYNAMLAEEADRHDEAMRAAQRQADPLGALLSDMREEIDVIGKSNAERAVMNVLRQEGIDIMSAEGQAALATAKAFEKEAEAKANSIALMDEWRNDVGDALADFATGAESAKDAALDFFDSFIEAAIRAATNKAVTDFFGAFGSDGSGSTGGGWLAKLAGMITGSGSSASSGFTSPFANGGAFDNGQVMAFANGGVVNSPTMFRMGLMGEAGPEAILPLHRGPDGKLGVRMAASNDERRGDTTLAPTYIFNVPSNRLPITELRAKDARLKREASRRN